MNPKEMANHMLTVMSMNEAVLHAENSLKIYHKQSVFGVSYRIFWNETLKNLNKL